MTFAQTFDLISLVSAISVVVPILAALVKYEMLNPVLKALLIFLLVCAVSDLLCAIYYEKKHLLNIFLNAFTVVEAYLIFYIYSKELDHSILAILAIVVISVVSCVQFFFFNLINSEDVVVTTVEAGLVTILASISIYKHLRDENLNHPTQFYFFWINLSFLFYFGAGLLLFAAGDFITHASRNIAYLLWSLYLVINIGCNILFAVGTWKIQKFSH